MDESGRKSTVEVVLGLPYLSDGPLTRTAREMQAPVLISANSFSSWRDDGPSPPGHELTLMERRQRVARGEKPPFATKRPQRMREWLGWNLRQLGAARGLASIDLDSAGFHAMAAWGGYPWTPEAYVLGLCAAHPFRRFASMDLCVEPEIAANRDEVRERIARTVALNRRCLLLSRDAGIADRLMHVIQGATAEDYLRCFDAMSGFVPEDAVIGVGSMCRRRAQGPEGIVAIVDRLDRSLPPGVRLHLFGLKSDGAEAVAMLTDRVASIDSQAYGVRARRIANDERRTDPSFSKSNAMVASVMRTWYLGQTMRMTRGLSAELQVGLPMPDAAEPRPATVLDALLVIVRAEFDELIADGEIDPADIVPDAWVLETVQDRVALLPDHVAAGDPYEGPHQIDAAGQDPAGPPHAAIVEAAALA